MGNCVSKKTGKPFKGVKNSVYLTKEKTISKDLKQINEEYSLFIINNYFIKFSTF